MSTTKTKRGWVVVAALTIGLGACGSDDSEQNQGPDASTGGTGGAGGGGARMRGEREQEVSRVSVAGGTTPAAVPRRAGGHGGPLGSACTEIGLQTGLCLRRLNDFNQGGPQWLLHRGLCKVRQRSLLTQPL